MRCPAAPGPPERPHGAGEGSGGVTRCLWRPPTRPSGAPHGLGLPGRGMGYGQVSRVSGLSGLLALPPAIRGPLAAWAQPRGRPHLEAGGRVGRIRGAGSRGRWNVRRGEERRRLHSRSLLTPRKRPGESQSLPGARSGPRARRWQLCGSRARRAPVSAGLRLQPPSARGLLRHRPPGRRHGNDQL
ncbi:uncharacterized protein LOC117720152 [Arvicanthis niloticus]|uniref:uncharacterized protein LOC117720152 n=1 Tax=Arvicanthis niloticus TaxID=61156 RepID=UPI00402B7ECD